MCATATLIHHINDGLTITGVAGAARGVAKVEARAASSSAGKATAQTNLDGLALEKPKVDKWIRTPSSLQDEMAMRAAKAGEGNCLPIKLNDPKYAGMMKMEYRVKSSNGKDTVIHYVYDPKTGQRMDFKFKKRSAE
ncbi:MAG: hypothetical protein KF798_06655 [Candidatus Paracaedibacteraceae bacterium]|nr:hypothetical protein [Candidatus Paracaedibacteraceae bacterium]